MHTNTCTWLIINSGVKRLVLISAKINTIIALLCPLFHRAFRLERWDVSTWHSFLWSALVYFPHPYAWWRHPCTIYGNTWMIMGYSGLWGHRRSWTFSHHSWWMQQNTHIYTYMYLVFTSQNLTYVFFSLLCGYTCTCRPTDPSNSLSWSFT